MDSKEKGWAVTYGVLVGAFVVVAWAKNAMELAITVAGVAGLFGLAALLEIMGFDPRPGRESGGAKPSGVPPEIRDSTPNPRRAPKRNRA